MGKTVQVIPHVTDAIQDWVERVAKIPVDESAKSPDVCIIEVGTQFTSFLRTIEIANNLFSRAAWWNCW